LRALSRCVHPIVSTQSLSNAGIKAAKLTARGVRRVFAIDVDAERVRILGERDPQQLDRWLAEAATCAEVAELFTMLR
jgi:hypothetical protein